MESFAGVGGKVVGELRTCLHCGPVYNGRETVRVLSSQCPVRMSDRHYPQQLPDLPKFPTSPSLPSSCALFPPMGCKYSQSLVLSNLLFFLHNLALKGISYLDILNS